MALKATICKAEINIADIDRGYYADHLLTLAQHPSENNERLMLRLLAFVLHAHEYLAFSKGLSDPDEPDIWQKDLTGTIDLWIDLGQPDEKRVLKACGRSRQVVVASYGNAVPIWWEGIAPKLMRASNLVVQRLMVQGDTPLADFVQKNMKLQCTVQDGQLWLSDDVRSAQINVVLLR
ncbi:MAG: YaeQ family protein [Paraperlucidibaca sp.]